MEKKICDLFEQKPRNWGMRGDPFLWQEMQDYFQGQPLPPNLQKLKELLIDAFLQITGQHLKPEHKFMLQKFAHGGMTSGYIDCDFWIDNGFPTIFATYEKEKGGS